jgi:hypothetical protein
VQQVAPEIAHITAYGSAAVVVAESIEIHPCCASWRARLHAEEDGKVVPAGDGGGQGRW